MTINREHLAGLELAKEILGGYTSDQVSDSPYIAITDAITQAQAAPEAEPVATIEVIVEGSCKMIDFDGQKAAFKLPAGVHDLYAAPQHDAELVELLRDAREDMESCALSIRDVEFWVPRLLEFHNRIDAKLATLSAKSEGGK